MDEYIRFCLVKIQTKNVMKLSIYICLDFVAMISNSLGQQGKWVPCKHMYYVLQHVMFYGQFESFIHFLTWNCDEVCHLLNRNVTLV